MATIKISDLHPAGYDFFTDSESYLSDLSEDELSLTQGGGFWATVGAAAIASGTLCLSVATIVVTAVGLGAYNGYQAGRQAAGRK